MTYDAKQLGAELRRCTVCGRESLMTAPQAVCIRCRQGDRLLTPQEAANLIGISANDVLRAIHDGDLYAVKRPAGKGWRYGIDRSEAERFMRDGSALPVSKSVATAASGEAGFVTPLVLSLFPGIGLLDMAFEREGFCVVRGPDLLWGGDVHQFHPPARKFDGVIGGPPCQRFSSLSNINRVKYGEASLAPNLIPEFERIVREAWPLWFVMENVPRAPQPQIEGYCVNPVVLNNRWFGEEQARVRRFTFGGDWRVAERFRVDMDEFSVLLNPKHEPTACATSGGRRRTPRRDRRGQLQSAVLLNRTRADLARLQGLPEDFLVDTPFTEREKMRVIGNGVPLPMGLAVARAVKVAMGYELEMSA